MNIEKWLKMNHNTQRTNYNEIDRLFETRLKPLRSRYARAIYWIFLNNQSLEYLTTLDIQKKLEQYELTLSKKEINASLKSLFIEKILEKDEERGKPTTIVYDDKYTYDKWSLTETGLALSQSLKLMVEYKDDPQPGIGYKVLTTLKADEAQTLSDIASNVILEHIDDGIQHSYIEAIEPKRSLQNTLRSLLGLNIEKQYRLTPNGVEYLKKKGSA